ncbi:MAG TPA: outer membrane beta-barrel protein, partial [Saprospiraceae bacterium]|nr:outer membrane beta-barrel protein [Saprospiraceae bacterium]
MKINHILLTLILMAGIQLAANAQLRLGAGLGYGTDIEELGLQLRGVYTISDPWRGAADFVFYFDGVEDLSIWELNLNAHYAFITDEKKTVYALAGLNFLKFNYDASSTFADNSDTGLNLGAGLELPISGPFEFFSEARITLGGSDQFFI